MKMKSKDALKSIHQDPEMTCKFLSNSLFLLERFHRFWISSVLDLKKVISHKYSAYTSKVHLFISTLK